MRRLPRINGQGLHAHRSRNRTIGIPLRGAVMDFPEADWKILRRVHSAGLERYCERVLAECDALLQQKNRSAHERYLGLCRHLKRRDRAIAWAFDDMRRSRAVERLVAMMTLEVVTPDELAQFSRGTRESAETLLALGRHRSDEL